MESKAVDRSSNNNIHVFPCSVAIRSSPTRITRAVFALYSSTDYEECWILAAGVLNASFPVFLFIHKSLYILSIHVSQTC